MSKIKISISRPIRVLLQFLLCAHLLGSGACSMVTGMTNRVDESDVDKYIPTIAALKADDQLAIVILVHRYTARCCGALPSVDLLGAQDSNKPWKSSLDPMEDFICWRVAPGSIFLAASIGEQPAVEYEVTVEAGQTLYLAVDSDLRQPPPNELEFNIISEVLGMHHVQKNLVRIRNFNSGGYPDELKAVVEQVKADGDKRVKQKLQCI